MAAYKFTVRRGALAKAQIAVAAGTDEAQGDTLSVNIDVAASNGVRKADVLAMLEAVKDRIFAGPWPPLA